jgi:hypothetical protein
MVSHPAPSVTRDAGGAVTGNETFVTVNNEAATLPNSRQLAAGAGIALADGGAGNPITVSSTVVAPTGITGASRWISAQEFVPDNTIPAPNERIYIGATTLRAYEAVKFVAGARTQAACAAGPIPGPIDIVGQWSWYLYWVTDNADTSNAVSWRINAYWQGNNTDLSSNYSYYQSFSDVSSGANFLSIVSGPSSGPAGVLTPWDFVSVAVDRNNTPDSMPGDAWLLGLALVWDEVLS